MMKTNVIRFYFLLYIQIVNKWNTVPVQYKSHEKIYKKLQLQEAFLKLDSSELNDESKRKPLQKKIADLTRKFGRYTYDVRQRKYIEPSSLEEELRLSISRCHIYGDDNEELYPLDLIEKVSRMRNLSNSDEDNKKYLNII